MQTGDRSSPRGGVLSLLTPIGYQSGDCGYCKSEESSQRTPDSRASYYARSKSLSSEHYQELMDRGWRRSGNLLYLPDASRSCCPHYTIRLSSSEFKPSRDQRQTLHRWNRYVLGENYISQANIKFPKTKEEKKRQNATFDLISTIHESESTNLRLGLEPDHHFEVTLESDKFTKEKFTLFENYQRHVHHEGDGDISEIGFRRFLCSSPLSTSTTDGKQHGSFHQCYRLDGRLIAMAVVDLLPHAVSGVYFIYHSDFEKWSFGKLSALRETALALEQGHEYYYMGYYIHGCKKMQYKADFRPQYVLDYLNLQWDVLDDEMRKLMDHRKYASMSRERAKRATRIDTLDKATPSAEQTDKQVNGSNNNNNNSDHDSDDDILFPLPLQATTSGLSILKLAIPGVMTPDQLRDQVDLDRMKIFLRRDGVYEVRNISTWDIGSELNPTSLKGVFAEFAAATGPVIAREAVVDFGS